MKMLLTALFVSVFLGICQARADKIEWVYPVKDWATKKPDEVGLNAEKLKELSDYAGGFGCVVRGGYMVYTWGDASSRKDVASAAKPLYS